MIITAETSDKCERYKDVNTHGPLNVRLKGLYGEHQIINYFKESIYVVDYENQRWEIVPTRNDINPEAHVEIQFRSILGARSFNELNSDNSKANHRKIIISGRLIRDEPVFSEILNMVITTETHVSQVVHPHSKEAMRRRLFVIQDGIANSAQQMPFTIVANDPTGSITNLYVRIDGRICAAKVLNFKDEPDNICVCYRDLSMPSNGHYIIRTSFEELRKNHPHVWTIEGCILSSNKSKLMQYLELHHIKVSEDSIPIETHIEQLDDIRKLGEQDRERLNEENALLKKKLNQINAELNDLKEGDFAASAAAFRFQELENQRLKLENERLNMEHEKAQREFKQQQEQQRHKNEQDLEREKMRREKLATIMTVVKVAGVVLPLGFAAWKLWKTK